LLDKQGVTGSNPVSPILSYKHLGQNKNYFQPPS